MRRRTVVILVVLAMGAGLALGWTTPARRFRVTAWEQVPLHTEPACTALVLPTAVIHDDVTGADVLVIQGSGAALIGYTGADGTFRPLTIPARHEVTDGEREAQ